MLTQFRSQRPVWKGAGTALGRGVAGPSSAQGVGSSMPSTLSIGLALTQTGSTEPLGVPSQYIPTTPGLLHPYSLCIFFDYRHS